MEDVVNTIFGICGFFTSCVFPIMVIAGIIAFANYRNRQLTDQYQRQCPNCGGYRVSGQRPDTASPYLFHCVICGYQWYWKEGTPWPSVRVQSDLISKGSAKLEQEEEERRRRQEALEGLHHLNQQNRK